MLYYNKSTLPALSYLRDVCRKRKEGYTKAAEIVKAPDIEKLFITFAKQSDDFEYELKHFSESGLSAESTETARLTGWRHFDNDLEETTLESILSVCEKEEKATIGDYEELLEEDLPEDVQACINQQLIEITAAYDTILSMKNESAQNRS